MRQARSSAPVSRDQVTARMTTVAVIPRPRPCATDLIAQSEASSEIRFVDPRQGPFVCAVDSMRVFDTGLFRHYGEAA